MERMEQPNQEPNMERAVKALKTAIVGLKILNQYIEDASIKISTNYNFDNQSLKDKSDAEIKRLKSKEFEADMSYTEKKFSEQHSKEFASLGLGIISVPEYTEQVAQPRTLNIIDSEKFSKYLSFLENSNLSEQDMSNLDFILEGEMKALLKFQFLQSEETDYEKNVDLFFDRGSEIIEKIKSIKEKFSKYPMTNESELSLYTLEIMNGAKEGGYFWEFTDFFGTRSVILEEVQNFKNDNDNFLGTFKIYAIKHKNYLEDYIYTMLNSLDYLSSEYKNNKMYAPIFEYIYNFSAALSSSLDNAFLKNEELKKKVENFELHLLKIRDDFDQTKTRYEK